MKKIFALLAGLLLSLNASASYTQYNFSPEDSSNIKGFFIQRDDNKAIAFYDVHVWHYGHETIFHNLGDGANLASAYNNYSGQGPTSFSVYYGLGGAYYESLFVNFEADNSALAFAMQYVQEKDHNAPPSVPAPMNLSDTGIVTKSAVDATMAAYLDSMGGYDDRINRIVPESRVPEPATLGLFALGAFAAGAARRRKAAR